MVQSQFRTDTGTRIQNAMQERFETEIGAKELALNDAFSFFYYTLFNSLLLLWVTSCLKSFALDKYFQNILRSIGEGAVVSPIISHMNLLSLSPSSGQYFSNK